MKDKTGLDPWVVGCGQIHTALESVVRSEVPERDSWRTACLQKLLATLLEANYMADEMEVLRLQGLIKSLLTN